MSDRQFDRPHDRLAQKWRDLVARKRDHLVELYDTGRWRHYYTEEEFVARMREVMRLLRTWDALAEAGVNRMAARVARAASR